MVNGRRLNAVLAQRGGNLKEPIFKDQTFKFSGGCLGEGMLKLRIAKISVTSPIVINKPTR